MIIWMNFLKFPINLELSFIAFTSAKLQLLKCSSVKEKKKEIWLSPMTKSPTPTENSKTEGQHTNATKNFDNTTIVDRLRTVSWSNNSSNWCG